MLGQCQLFHLPLFLHRAALSRNVAGNPACPRSLRLPERSTGAESVLLFSPLLLFRFFRQSFTMKTRLAVNLQRSKCLGLPAAGIKGVGHHQAQVQRLLLESM